MNSLSYLCMILLIYLLDLFIAQLFFSDLFEKRFHKSIVFLIGFLIFESGALVLHGKSFSIWAHIFYFALEHVLFLLICFRTKNARRRLFPLLLIAGITITKILFVIIGFPVLEGIGFDPVFFLPFAEIVLKTIYCLLTAILLHVSRKRDEPGKISAAYYIYPVFCVLTLMGFWTLSIGSALDFEGQPILVGVGLVLFFSTIILIFAQYSSVERERELLLLRQQTEKMQTERRYYEILEKKEEALQIYAHDAKNHLLALKALTTDQRALSYIDKMESSLSAYSSLRRTGNKLLNVMLDRYLSQCELEGVSFCAATNNNSLQNIDDFDLVAILGNLLDNAIEAATGTKERFVSVEITDDPRFTVIEIVNSCEHAPSQTASGGWKTHKRDVSRHGYGLKSVKRTLGKYGGDVELMYAPEENKMHATVMVPHKEVVKK